MAPRPGCIGVGTPYANTIGCAAGAGPAGVTREAGELGASPIFLYFSLFFLFFFFFFPANFSFFRLTSSLDVETESELDVVEVDSVCCDSELDPDSDTRFFLR